MRLLAMALLLLCCSCTTTFQNPMTHTMYKGEIKEEGLSLTITPPGWKYCCDLYNWLTD